MHSLLLARWSALQNPIATAARVILIKGQMLSYFYVVFDLPNIDEFLASGLGYFVDLFGNRVRSYVSRIVSKTKPRLVVICMIYYPDVYGRGSWADATLNLLGYNFAPQLLQKAIRVVYEYGTRRIRIPGAHVVPIPLFKVLDGSDTDDYVRDIV